MFVAYPSSLPRRPRKVRDPVKRARRATVTAWVLGATAAVLLWQLGAATTERDVAQQAVDERRRADAFDERQEAAERQWRGERLWYADGVARLSNGWEYAGSHGSYDSDTGLSSYSLRVFNGTGGPARVSVTLTVHSEDDPFPSVEVLTAASAEPVEPGSHVTLDLPVSAERRANIVAWSATSL